MVSNGAKNEPTAYGTATDMEEEIMEEKIEGKKCDQMFMEELSGMLCAIVTMLSSISALSAVLLAQSADERESARFLASKLAEDSACYYREAIDIKKMREGGSDGQR